jgi:hypothetical protein
MQVVAPGVREEVFVVGGAIHRLALLLEREEWKVGFEVML